MTGSSLGSVRERRARLARRHLLAAPGRAETAAEVAAALIALHGTDPASVYLAAWARSADGHRAVGHAAVERALYDTGELIRMLGMRRTMFVVPADLAPGIQASCTEQIAERMRSGLVRDLAAAGVAPDAGRWLEEVENAAVKALIARGTATGAELARDEPLLRTRLSYAEGKSYGGTANVTSRVLMLLSAERRIARGRPRGGWTSSQYEWAPADPWPAGSAADSRVQLARRWLLAFGPAPVSDLQWWTGWTAPRVSCWRVMRIPSRAPRRGRRYCRPWTRRLWAGVTAAGSSAGTRPRCSTGRGTSGPPSGGTAGSWAAGHSTPAGRSCSACWKTPAPRPWRR